MKRLRLALFFGLGVVGVASLAIPAKMLLAGQPDDARPMVQRALVALAKNDPRAARVELMNAIRADPSWSVARIAQARVMLALGDGQSAQGELERARSLGAKLGATRHLMAHALFLTGDYASALKEAQAPDLIPEQAAYAARIAACAHQALGQTPQAAAAFEQSLILGPKDAATWIDVSRFHLGHGDRAAALTASDRAMALAPRDPAALTLRAELIRDQYGMKASLPWFDQALAIDANYLPALTQYAATLTEMGQAQKALSLTRRIVALDAKNARAFYIQAVIAARAGNMDLARRMMDKVGGRLDAEPAMLLFRGIIYLANGNAALATEPLKALVQVQPFNFQARLLYGRALFESGQRQDADAILAPLAQRPDADSYTLTMAARVRAVLGDEAGSEALLARAARPDMGASTLLPLDPDIGSLAAQANADTRAAGPNISYVRILLSRGEAGQALGRAATLRDANRGAPEAHVALGDALAQAGRWDQAANNYVAAANLNYSENVALRLASAWTRAGLPARADQTLTLYLQQNPGSIGANRLAASAWMHSDDWVRASAALEAVRARIGNDDAYLLADLSWANLGLGDTPRALTYAEHAYRLFPASPITTDAYGWMLFKARGPNQASIDLLEKAVALAPGNALLARRLEAARMSFLRKG
ncbi:MAG: tetratricopeptide repeat protein [Sphingobium sp.]